MILNKQFIYCSAPRTGNSFVQQILAGIEGNKAYYKSHLMSSTHFQKARNIIFGIRDPVSWYWSNYCYRMGRGKGDFTRKYKLDKFDRMVRLQSGSRISSDDFLYFMEDIQTFRGAVFQRFQSEFVGGPTYTPFQMMILRSCLTKPFAASVAELGCSLEMIEAKVNKRLFIYDLSGSQDLVTQLSCILVTIGFTENFVNNYLSLVFVDDNGPATNSEPNECKFDLHQILNSFDFIKHDISFYRKMIEGRKQL